MTDVNETLIRLEDITKVFHTDEVETHALSQVTLEIKRGKYISIFRAVGLRKIHAALPARPAGLAHLRLLLARRQARSEFIRQRSHAHPQL